MCVCVWYVCVYIYSLRASHILIPLSFPLSFPVCSHPLPCSARQSAAIAATMARDDLNRSVVIRLKRSLAKARVDKQGEKRGRRGWTEWEKRGEDQVTNCGVCVTYSFSNLIFFFCACSLSCSFSFPLFPSPCSCPSSCPSSSPSFSPSSSPVSLSGCPRHTCTIMCTIMRTIDRVQRLLP